MMLFKNLHLKKWFGDRARLSDLDAGKIEFKLRYYENALGLLWALIKPITSLLMYYIVQCGHKQDIPSSFPTYLSG